MCQSTASTSDSADSRLQGLCFFQTEHAPAHRFDPFPESPPPLGASIRAGAAMAMSSIRSALARAFIAPKLRAPHRFAATAAAGETQPERVAAEMVRYALGGAVHRSSPGFPLVPLPLC